MVVRVLDDVADVAVGGADEARIVRALLGYAERDRHIGTNPSPRDARDRTSYEHRGASK